MVVTRGWDESSWCKIRLLGLLQSSKSTYLIKPHNVPAWLTGLASTSPSLSLNCNGCTNTKLTDTQQDNRQDRMPLHCSKL